VDYLCGNVEYLCVNVEYLCGDINTDTTSDIVGEHRSLVAEYSLFYRVVLQKKPVFLGSYEIYRDQLRYCRSLFLHTMQTQSGMSVLSVCVSPHTPPNTDTTLSVYIVGRYSSAYLCGVYGEIQTKHLCGEIKTDIELSEIVAVSISPHTCVECVEKHRNTTLCLYLVECVEKHRQTVQIYNVEYVLGGVCGERLTDNADIRRCVCIWWSVWRNTDKPYRCTTVCLHLVECLEKYRQTSQTCNVVSVLCGVCGERQR